MKNTKITNLNSQLQKVRSKLNAEHFFTHPNWDVKIVDGVVFIPVLKQKPDGSIEQKVMWMRKDNMEYVK
jgi:hypothetical protein